MMQTQQNADSFGLTIAIVVFAAIAPAILMTAPTIATQLATEWQLSKVEIGYLLSGELGAMSLATLPAYYWLSRFSWRKVAIIAAVIFILGNILSTLVTDYSGLLIARVISALAGGTLMIISMTCAAKSNNPNRAYGLWVLGQLILGAIGLYILPKLFNNYGLKSCYILLIILMLICFPLVWQFPHSKATIHKTSTQTVTPLSHKFYSLLAILAVFCFYVGLSSVWTFMGDIGSHSQLNPEQTGSILSIATLLGILGATTATFINNKISITIMLCLGYCLMLTSMVILFGNLGVVRFSIAALLFKYTWTFVLPFILAGIAAKDMTGKIVNSVNLVIGGGIAVGPVLAGYLIKFNEGSFAFLLSFALIVTLCSFCLILIFHYLYKNN